ncbi:MlaD family protein [Bacteroidota bacterium]
MLRYLKGARLGLFIFLGTVCLVIAIFLIGSKEALFISSITLKTKFTRVEGLKTGAPVRLSGYTIGSVSNIELADDTSGNVLVTMNVDKNIRHFIRLDSEASIETEGLVGKKVVSISPGSKELEMISDGSTITSKAPVSIVEIMEETKSIMAYVKDITKDFSEIVAKINQGDGTIGRIINDEALYDASVTLTKTADTSLALMTERLDEVSGFLVEVSGGAANIFKTIDTTITDIKYLISDVGKGKGVLGALIADRSAYDSIKTVIDNLVITTQALMQGSNSFTENMEALKHNWLFKSYFEERGYWDKSEYEKEIENKIELLRKQNEFLEKKLEELKELGINVDELKLNQNSPDNR